MKRWMDSIPNFRRGGSAAVAVRRTARATLPSTTGARPNWTRSRRSAASSTKCASEFDNYLRELRRAKDQEEFDRFMRERNSGGSGSVPRIPGSLTVAVFNRNSRRLQGRRLFYGKQECKRAARFSSSCIDRANRLSRRMFSLLRKSLRSLKSSPAPVTRTLDVAGRAMPLTIRQNARATRMTLRIEPGGRALRMTVPTGLPEREIKAFLDRHQGWLMTKLARFSGESDLEEGGTILVRGVAHRIERTGKLRRPDRGDPGRG